MISSVASHTPSGMSGTLGCPSFGSGMGTCDCSGSTAVSIGGTAGRTPAETATEFNAVPGQDDAARLRELQQRDTEVRAHEQAHVSAGGRYVMGGARYTTVTGPDNRQYATGGEVSIDTSPIPGNPDATLEKARTVRRAALAPSNPSGQDMQVAAQAAQMETQARMDKVQGQGAETRFTLQADSFADDLEQGTPTQAPRHAVQAYENASGDPPPRNGDFSLFA